jgi:hypothetical protein
MYHHLHLLFLFPIYFFFLNKTKTKTNKISVSNVPSSQTPRATCTTRVSRSVNPSNRLSLALYLFIYFYIPYPTNKNIERKTVVCCCSFFFSGTLSKRLERESNLFSWLSCYLFKKKKGPGVETRATSNTHCQDNLEKKTFFIHSPIKIFICLFLKKKRKKTFD